MYKLEKPFAVYNKQYKRNFLIVYSNLHSQFIDENMIVHEVQYLQLKKDGIERPHISKAGLI